MDYCKSQRLTTTGAMITVYKINGEDIVAMDPILIPFYENNIQLVFLYIGTS